MTVTKPDVWDLQAETGFLDSAKTAWQTLATDLGNESTWQSDRVEELRLNWECSMATSYFGHGTSVSTALGTTSDTAGAVATVLGDLKSDVQTAQNELDSSFARASANVKSYERANGMVTFTPWNDEDDLPEIDTEFDAAVGIVDEAIEQVRSRKQRLDELAGDARGIKQTWNAAADGTDPGWDVPTGSTSGVQVTSLDGTTVITTGDGNDTVEVTVDPDTGETIVTITDSLGNTTVERVPAGEEVVVNTGMGNDEITVPRGTSVHVRFATGAGEDTVSAQGTEGDIEAFGGDDVDTIETGAGDDFVSGGRDSDYVDGGAGNDVLAGSLGNDVIYGMDGDDVVIGGAGRDYLEGATGDDRMFGGADEDVVSGGYGDDRIWAGSGDDTVYAGGGTDTIDGEGGSGDEVFAEAGDVAPGGESVVIVEIPSEEEYTRWLEFEVGGSQEFKDRVLADLHMMASSPVGQRMLERQNEHYEASDNGLFDFSKEKVVIRETTDNNNYANPDNSVELNPSYTSPGSGNGGSHDKGYDDPDYDITPPAVFFFHELGHINQFRSGEADQFGNRTYSDGTPLIERQNVGLEWDHDGDPATPEMVDPDYDFDFTENGFREELGLPERNRY